MDRNEVGIVLVQDLSRLSRRRSDISSFQERTEEGGVLIYTNGALHNPAAGDLAATLGLDIAGLFGNFDNRLRVRRMREAKIAKAKRGQAVSPPPIGYVRTPGGGWAKDSDLAVQEAVARVFDLYPKLGSLGKVANYFREHNLEFPRRSQGQIRWGPVDAPLLHSVLRNPAYCGDYVYQRRQTKKRADGAGVSVKFRSPDQWIERPDHHEAYLPREEWQKIQEMLAARRPALRPLIGKGHALLQGVLKCGADGCGRRMKTEYSGRDGMARTATYTCRRLNGWGDPTHRVTFPARFIDHAVVTRVLQVLTTIDDETARRVIERSQQEQAGLEREKRRRLLDAEAEVDRHRGALLNVPPHLQHARVDLMTQLDGAVQRCSELKTQLARETIPLPSVMAADVGELIRLSHNIGQLWASPRRTNEERKRLLQTLISEVILHRADRDVAEVEIVWKGGLRERFQVLRARGVEAVVRDLTLQGKTAARIADELNAAGVITATGRPMSSNVVAQKQGRQGVRLKEERRRARDVIRRGLLDNTPRPEILHQLQEKAPRLGPWNPQRLSDAIGQLRQGAANDGTLPRVLPAELEKERVLAFINDGVAAGRTWKAMAVALNEASLRPPRGKTFTPVQVRLLYLRAHKLRSFKLPSPRSDTPAAGA